MAELTFHGIGRTSLPFLSPAFERL